MAGMSMASFTAARRRGEEQFGGGMMLAAVLHAVLAITLLTVAIVKGRHHASWGENISSAGAIQASLVSALPLPPKVPPVEKQVLAEENPSPAPKPPPKEATAPPPKPTDVLVKAKTPDKPTKTAPDPTPEPPKHPQPTPPTPKADTGSSATQLAQSVSQVKNGTSAITVEDHTFGVRFAYYIRGMDRVISQSYNQQDIDQRSANGKSVTLRFDIEKDGTLSNIHIATSSGSASLDTAALRTFQRIDSFGPLPVDHENVTWTLQFHVN